MSPSSILNQINYTLLNEEKFLNNLKYNKDGYYVHKRDKREDYKVTVIIPVYNAENSLKVTIDSIINQTIGFENIELLIVDDNSEDNSRSVILDYAKKYRNVVPIFLEENSGSPSRPRNLGIDLSTGKYITFIDSDDWLHLEGIKVLYNLLEKSGDAYAVGKTIKVEDNGQYIIGEYNSWKDRISIDPLSISKIFYHLGPTGRMMKAEFLKEKGIRFPNMKFAEDKQFFIEVLTQCDTISTSKEIIYYANRYSNNESFTKTTTIFEKTDTNISLINHVIQKKLSKRVEKMILNRLYEFDCITRLFDRWHFLKSDEKEKYFEKFSQVIATSESLGDNFEDYLKEPWHITLVDLFKAERYEDIVNLIKWSRKETVKEYEIKDGLPFYLLPIKKYNIVRINMFAIHHKTLREDDQLVLQFKVFGDYVNEIQSLVARQRDNDLNQLEFPIEKLDNSLFQSVIPYTDLDKLSLASHSIFIKYNDYMKLNIRMNSRNVINHNKKRYDFYVTISDNFGINIK
ncbi:glycosyl transferase [Oceanobacillus picturae]|uniref:Glycosyl transferase n=1 Tax=Oceanobacillus picturae TaxID=171693 RepID=A0A0U9H6F6_9BACI|nr:glycosyltransferase family 2 protein [Oceanobacillus picturae]GAQ16881.1 glycosyl transferase [Oceanobacillus picturae]